MTKTRKECPFHAGDIITFAEPESWKAAGVTGQQYMPGRERLAVLRANAQRGVNCESGWLLFGMDSGWFRLATASDIFLALDAQLRSMNTAVRTLETALTVVRGTYSLLKQLGVKEAGQ